MRNPTIGMLRSIFAFTALLAAAGVHAQQKITVQAATNVFNQVLGVSFAPPGSTTVLNTDGPSLHRLESLTFVTNPNTFFVDLLAADDGGNVLRYATDFTCQPPQSCTTGTVVSQAAPIGNPNGLSADPFGNVYLVNNAPGSSPLPAVWALPTDGNGGYNQAVQIDTTSPPGSFGQHQSVVETLSIRTPLGTLLKTGDLLVVSQNPDEILLYPANAVSQLLQNGGGPPVSPQPFIPTCPAQPVCIPAGSTPGGIAVWPADNSLLVTTFSGQILRFGTATGSLTPLAPVSGLPAGNLYKINTGLTNGGPVAYVAQSSPGNHGSILQLVPSASNGIQFIASVTAPGSVQGIAVTNTVQAPEGGCLAANGGCDLFGSTLNKHTVKPIPGSPALPAGNIVESLCVVAQDPRGPAGTCDGVSTLRVNDVCPGFDNTVGGSPMTIPGYACGSSGTSGSAFALIKTLTAPSQFNGTIIETEQDPNAMLPGPNNPVCWNNSLPGIGLWAPLQNETLIAEAVVGSSIVNPLNPMPTLVDFTEGCGTIKGNGPQVSVFASGVALSLPGGNSQTHLQAFVQQKYPFLNTTITQLAHNGNIPAGVAQQLTNPPGNQPGCFDLSQSLFNKAVGEADPNNPQQLTSQQIADFQDAADLLTNADTTVAATTCDSIVTKNASSFVETQPPPPASPVYNPTGQLRWRFANIANGITSRILNLPPAGTWPTPVSVSGSPQYLFAKCVLPGCPPQQNPSTATISWALASGVSCPTGGGQPWNSNDGTFGQPPVAKNSASVGPFTTAGMTYRYTLTCNVPPATMPSAPTLTAAPSGLYAGGTLTAAWPNSSGMNYQVMLSTGQVISACSFTQGNPTFTCPATNITGTPSTTITVSPITMSASTYVTVWPAVVVTTSAQSVVAGNSVQVYWTPPAGATACTLTNNGQGTFNAGLTSVSGPVPKPPNNSYQASYLTNQHDVSKGVTFAATCAAGASAGVASITVTHH